MNVYTTLTPQKGEITSTLLAHKNVKINHIVSADTLEEKDYLQQEDEWLVLLKGEASLLIDGKTVHLSKGETLFIPADTPHRILSTENGTIWLTVHIF